MRTSIRAPPGHDPSGVMRRTSASGSQRRAPSAIATPSMLAATMPLAGSIGSLKRISSSAVRAMWSSPFRGRVDVTIGGSRSGTVASVPESTPASSSVGPPSGDGVPPQPATARRKIDTHRRPMRHSVRGGTRVTDRWSAGLQTAHPDAARPRAGRRCQECPSFSVA
jgi:hypothetical protein